MLEAMLSHLNNWFAAPGGRHRGTFHIVCGVPDVDFLKEGQYFRIRGSVYNDGLHRTGTAVPPSTSDVALTRSDASAHEAGTAVPSSSSDAAFSQNGTSANEAEVADDGVKNEDVLRDETFTGEIWALAVPPSIVALAEEIAAWRKSNPETDRVSESFGGYSYSRGDAPGGAVGGWQAAFASRLNPYRRVYDD